MIDINVCMSGGAEGADLEWGKWAATRKDSVIHYSFAGHRTNAPAETVIILSADELKVVDKKLKYANKTLKRKIPFHTYTKNLLRRNAYQIEMAKSVYAISTIENNLVQGGTGWACQMFLDSLSIFDHSPLYVFDQEKNQWFVWNKLGYFDAIDTPPPPSGIYAAIGTRNLNDNGRNAIRKLYEV